MWIIYWLINSLVLHIKTIQNNPIFLMIFSNASFCLIWWSSIWSVLINIFWWNVLFWLMIFISFHGSVRLLFLGFIVINVQFLLLGCYFKCSRVQVVLWRFMMFDGDYIIMIDSPYLFLPLVAMLWGFEWLKSTSLSPTSQDMLRKHVKLRYVKTVKVC